MKKLSSFLLLLLAVFTAQAQIQEPVKFKTELKTLSGAEAEIVFTGTIDAGWHVYSTDLGDGGPISATFNVEKMSGAEVVGKLTPRGKEVSDFDKLFEMKVRYFEKTAQFIQKIKFTGSDYSIEGYLEYGACNDENCLPPTQVPFKFSGKAAATAEVSAKETPATPVKEPVATVTDSIVEPAATTVTTAIGSVDLWKPVINDLKKFGEANSQEDMSWIYIFITGFLGGLLALFTPCVWPIIPMTVSFFLSEARTKRKVSGMHGLMGHPSW